MDKQFWHALVILVLITDPLGNIPLFISALENVKPERKLKVCLRETLIAFVIMLLAMLGGKNAMEILGLNDAGLKVAGGVILLLMAINMVFPGSGANLNGETKSKLEPLIVPIAIPLISGPSAIATAMLVAANEPAKMPLWIAALAICMGISFLSLILSGTLKKLLGEQVIGAFERMMGLVLTAISVDMILEGVKVYIAS